MGCTSSKAGVKTNECKKAAQLPQQQEKDAAPGTLLNSKATEITMPRYGLPKHLGNPYRDMEHTRFADILKTGKLAVVKASYFERCLSNGVPFEDRASIPPEYIMKGNDVINTWKKHGAKCLVIFSYAWLTAQHPDPDMFHLKTIVTILRSMQKPPSSTLSMRRFSGVLLEDIGVILDYCSLWQKGHSKEDQRTAAQIEEFKEGLKEINTPYAHQEITAVKLMAVPDVVQRKYEDRGWTLFESILIDGKAASVMLGETPNCAGHENVLVADKQYDPAKFPDGVRLKHLAESGNCGFENRRRSPPMTPERFKLEMEKRKSRAKSKGVPLFTNGSDQPFILDKYVAAFNQAVLSVRAYEFEYLNWDLADIDCFADVLVHCPELRVLHLGHNNIGDAGAEKLSKILGHLPNLNELHLEHNNIGNVGYAKLKEAVEGRRLTLYLAGNTYDHSIYEGETFRP